MTEREKLLQEICLAFLERKDFSVHSFLNRFILVGYGEKNFLFEVCPENEPPSPMNWNGEKHSIKSYQEAILIIMKESLSF